MGPEALQALNFPHKAITGSIGFLMNCDTCAVICVKAQKLPATSWTDASKTCHLVSRRFPVQSSLDFNYCKRSILLKHNRVVRVYVIREWCGQDYFVGDVYNKLAVNWNSNSGFWLLIIGIMMNGMSVVLYCISTGYR